MMISKINHKQQELSDEEYQADEQYEQERYTDTWSESYTDDPDYERERFTDDSAYSEYFEDDENKDDRFTDDYNEDFKD
jgi:hypothetical protein